MAAQASVERLPGAQTERGTPKAELREGLAITASPCAFLIPHSGFGYSGPSAGACACRNARGPQDDLTLARFGRIVLPPATTERPAFPIGPPEVRESC